MTTQTEAPPSLKQLEYRNNLLQKRIAKAANDLKAWREEQKQVRAQLAEARKVEKERLQAKKEGNGKARAAPKKQAKQKELALDEEE